MWPDRSPMLAAHGGFHADHPPGRFRPARRQRIRNRGRDPLPNQAACHGLGGGQAVNALVAETALLEAQGVRTIGSYWPYATTLYDYVATAMPYGNVGRSIAMRRTRSWPICCS